MASRFDDDGSDGVSGVRNRLVGALGSDPATIEQLVRRVEELEATVRDERDRQAAAVRDATADLSERLAAIERRLDVLEAAPDA